MATQTKTDNKEQEQKKGTYLEVVSNKVSAYRDRGELDLPADYSPDNAMKSAYLILQNTLTTDKKPVLAACTPESICNSMLDMVVQGLSPAKNQCYFIAYGNKLTCQRSYFGAMAVAKRVDPTIGEIVAEVVYADDVFKYKIVRGNKEIVEHEQELENIDPVNIIAAYCLIIGTDGTVKKTEIMTMDQIKQSWKQSQLNPVDEKGNIKPGSTHGKFTADMCKRTVINRACKPIVNASGDKHLIRAFNRASEVSTEAEVEREIADHANGEIIDIESVEIPETETAQNEQKQLENTPENSKNDAKTEKSESAQQTIGGGPGW